MHVDDDVAILVVDKIQRQRAVFSFREDDSEEGSDTFDDADVKFRLRDEVGKF